MGLIKVGLQAGTAYVIANKIAKAREQVTPHPACNCPHCPYSDASEAFINSSAPQSSMPHAPYGNAPQQPMPHAPYGGSSRNVMTRSSPNAVFVVHQTLPQPQPQPQPEPMESYPAAPPSYDSSNSSHDFARAEKKKASLGKSGFDRRFAW